MNGNFEIGDYIRDGEELKIDSNLVFVCSMIFSVIRSNHPLVTELGTSLEIHDLHRGNIVEELSLHSEYYSAIRGRQKQMVKKRRDNVMKIKPNRRNWEFVEEEKKDCEKVVVLRSSLSTESIPIFRTVQYFNSI